MLKTGLGLSCDELVQNVSLPHDQTKGESKQAISDTKRGIGRHVIFLSETVDARRCPETEEEGVRNCRVSQLKVDCNIRIL